MPHLNGSASSLLPKYLSLFQSLGRNKEILDLACGNGRNGLFLVKNNVHVTFVDKNRKALAEISSSIKGGGYKHQKCLHYDLEDGENSPLKPERFVSILVFNYLHRPLFPAIRSAILKGGYIFYETFTTAQTKFGRPKNPNFLLKESELLEKFEGWEIIEYFEGIKIDPLRSIASLVARKP